MKNKLKALFQKIKEKLKPVGEFCTRGVQWVMKYTGLFWLKKQAERIPNRIKQAIYGLLFITPWLFGLGVIGLPLLARSIRMALSDKYYFVAGVGWQINGKWSDFTQFKRIFTAEPYHLTRIVETIQDIALVVPLVVIFALLLGVILNQKDRKSVG